MNENHGPDGKFASGDSGGLAKSSGSAFRGKGNVAQLRQFLNGQLSTYTSILKKTGDEDRARDTVHAMAMKAGIRGINAERTVTIAIQRFDDHLNRSRK